MAQCSHDCSRTACALERTNASVRSHGRRWIVFVAAIVFLAISERSNAVAACDEGPFPVIITASASAVAEIGGGDGQFVFSVLGLPGGADTVITLAVSGTATNGLDYQAIPPAVVLPAGQTQGVLTLAPIFNGAGVKTVTVSMTGTDNACITVGSPSSASIAIVDRDALPSATADTTMVVPIVAQTASFGTEVYVRNDAGGPITLDMNFYEALQSAAPGPHSCTAFVVPAHSTNLLTAGTQCTLGAGSHFGLLVLADAAVPKEHTFTVFSRSQTPAGVGFSVEGFPLFAFGGAAGTVDGLKRTSSGANYQSNCFVAALADDIEYQIDLSTQDGVAIGVPLTGALTSHQMVRYLDVFAHAAAAPGDYTNVRARITEIAPGGSPFIAFCTLQESITFSADFRIAKPDALVATPMVVPIAAHTVSFNSEVYVRNANAVPLALDVNFYEADNLPTAGQRPCDPFTVPAQASRLLALGTQCALGAGSHFGMLILQETAAPGTHPFAVFSRTQTPAGVGFSVEGVQLTHFGVGPAAVDGLKRSSLGPQYLANCFVTAPVGDLDYRIDLSTSTGAAIGTPIFGSLASHHAIRYLDVLAAAGAPPIDYTNVRAKFTETSPGTAPLIGFCTMQESVTFGADFRVAK